MQRKFLRVDIIKPYDDGGLVHGTDNHAYRISEAEYQELRTLLRKEQPWQT